MRCQLLVVVVLALFLPASLEAADTVKIATWNIENLRAEVNQGPNPRGPADFARLRQVAPRLDADIIALQEVDGPNAAARVFDPSKYEFFFSRRAHPQRTGFAVRKTLRVEQHPDVTTLNVTGGLRHGTDITVSVGDTALRLLSVHLKSGCFDRPLDDATDACEKLNRQVPQLEAWIDARAAEGIPFMVLGDWNRRFDVPGDTFWPEIDDGEPANADLTRITEGRTSACWGGEFPLYIDHIAFDKRASRFVVAGSFEQILFEEDIALKPKLSDHCPLAVSLEVSETPRPMLREELLRRIEAIAQELTRLRQLVESLSQ